MQGNGVVGSIVPTFIGDRCIYIDWDARKVYSSVVEDEVVALAIAPWLADGEVALAGLSKEGGFGMFSGALGVGTAGGLGGAGWERRLGSELLHSKKMKRGA